jgi:hypothetical protein
MSELSQLIEAAHVRRPWTELLALDGALEGFAVREPVKAERVKLRSVTGFTGHQAAELLGISPGTAARQDKSHRRAVNLRPAFPCMGIWTPP